MIDDPAQRVAIAIVAPICPLIPAVILLIIAVLQPWWVSSRDITYYPTNTSSFTVTQRSEISLWGHHGCKLNETWSDICGLPDAECVYPPAPPLGYIPPWTPPPLTEDDNWRVEVVTGPPGVRMTTTRQDRPFRCVTGNCQLPVVTTTIDRSNLNQDPNSINQNSVSFGDGQARLGEEVQAALGPFGEKVLRDLKKAKRPDLACLVLEILQSEGTPSTKHLNLAISACASAKWWAQALSLLFVSAPRLGLAPNVVTLSAALSACERSSRWPRALQLFHAQRALKVSPDVVVYNSAISACERGGQWQKALMLFEEMPSAGVRRDTITYNATLSSLQKAGQSERAVDLFNSMPQATISPDLISYNTTISACEKGGQWQEGLRLLQGIGRLGGRPDVVSYSAAISCCEKAARWILALELLNSMPKEGVPPNSISYNAAISACEKGGSWKMALQLLDQMPQARLSPTVVSYGAALSSCEKSSLWQMALEIFRSMSEAGVAPNTAGQWQLCLQLLQALPPPSEQAAPDLYAYSLSMSCCICGAVGERAHQWRASIHVWESLLQAKVTPDTVCLNACITSCVRGLLWQRACHLLQSMPEAKVAIDVVSYNAAMTACAKGKRWQLALNLYAAMPLAAMAPDAVSCNVLLDCVSDQRVRQALAKDLMTVLRKVKVVSSNEAG
ncbi:unnamed protein product [Symbiodinium natans]|uniref:Pentatricopeptide repeat-containing protein, chloroplastic n=1 Tax=Symbiodinium natans TaxID=878477 RepID=A0A812K5G1_9DINO|nr:unnamed protein product [Symbiodinium natans]